MMPPPRRDSAPDVLEDLPYRDRLTPPVADAERIAVSHGPGAPPHPPRAQCRRRWTAGRRRCACPRPGAGARPRRRSRSRSAPPGPAGAARRTAPAAHRAVPQIRASARQAVREVGVALEVLGPGPAPERRGELPLAVDEHDGLGRALALLQELRERTRAVRALLRHRQVWWVVVPAAHASAVARRRSRATMAISSPSLISVSTVSAPTWSTPRTIACLSSMSRSMRSSTVPRHTSLCTSTFWCWPMR